MVDKDNTGSVADSTGTLFESDTLASYRYHKIFESRQIAPEKRLILAILDDAVQSFIATVKPRSPKELREFEEAQMWIMEADSEWIFSFESICSQLGLDPDYLRSGLLKLKAEARDKHHSHTAIGNRVLRDRVGLTRSTLQQPSRAVSSARGRPIGDFGVRVMRRKAAEPENAPH